MVSRVKKLPFELIFTTSFFGCFFFRDTAEIAERLSIFSISLLFRRMDNWKRICTSYTIFGFFPGEYMQLYLNNIDVKYFHYSNCLLKGLHVHPLLHLHLFQIHFPNSVNIHTCTGTHYTHTALQVKTHYIHTLLCIWKFTTHRHCIYQNCMLLRHSIFYIPKVGKVVLYSIYQKLVKQFKRG